ncbi:MAG: Crp/Fnr family transcriptional regulator [Myxococcota bacterium]
MKPSDIERVFGAEEALFEPGAPSRELYVVSSGEVRLEPEGRLVGPGGIVGELSLLTGQPEPGRAIAEGEVTALVLDLPLLQKLCVECPEFSLRLIRHLAERLVRSIQPASEAGSLAGDESDAESTLDPAHVSATALVARAILELASEGEGPEPVTGRLRDLAAACSLDLRETYLGVQGLLESRFVRLAEDELQLVDRPGLEAIASMSPGSPRD